MVKAMTPSTNTITEGQIGKIAELLSPALRKSGLPRDATQDVLETQGEALAAALVGEIRKRVEAVSDLIVRRVKVNRAQEPRAALEATGRKLYVNNEVVATMPRGEGEEVDVYFFPGKRSMSDAELEAAYELHGLKPDPYAQAAVNEADPAFADEKPNGTHWKDSNGKWCDAIFDRWNDGRGVDVDRRGSGWNDDWWFGGVRKVTLRT